MSKRQLAAVVQLRGPDGRSVVLRPGDEVPAWAARLITNPKAWGEGAADTAAPTTTPADAGGVEAPPRSGRGSGEAAWRAFAKAHGVDTDDEMSRDDVIAACERAGVINPEV